MWMIRETRKKNYLPEAWGPLAFLTHTWACGIILDVCALVRNSTAPNTDFHSAKHKCSPAPLHSNIYTFVYQLRSCFCSCLERFACTMFPYPLSL